MSRIRIRPKWLSNCSAEELQQLNRLRFKGDSMMYEDVIKLPLNEHRQLVRVFLAKDGENIVGWSCSLFPPKKKSCLYVVPNKTKYVPIYTYVSRAHQGEGLGKRLLKRAATNAISQRYKPAVFFWDEGSSKFFAKIREDVPKLEIFDVSEWWNLYE